MLSVSARHLRLRLHANGSMPRPVRTPVSEAVPIIGLSLGAAINAG